MDLASLYYLLSALAILKLLLWDLNAFYIIWRMFSSLVFYTFVYINGYTMSLGLFVMALIYFDYDAWVCIPLYHLYYLLALSDNLLESYGSLYGSTSWSILSNIMQNESMRNKLIEIKPQQAIWQWWIHVAFSAKTLSDARNWTIKPNRLRH